ncbi:MAG: pyridoxine 5'-phosphate synthase [Phycisphaerae bacterium]|nr:pyridoxine 5'-phosphate synthase [Phycisphaerae bacterium]
MPVLGMNIDHVATLREARYRTGAAGAGPAALAEPDPARAVHEAELGGAACITMHLREDRRHVNDRDVAVCRELTRVKFNLEMAATDAMAEVALLLRPHMCTLVPEGRREVTTEGGLDVAGQAPRLGAVVARLAGAGIEASAFIDPEEAQVRAAADAGFAACELHTGPYAHAFALSAGRPGDAGLAAELGRLARAGEAIRARGLRFNIGHALNYANVIPAASLPGVSEAHVGHSIVSRAVFVGLRAAVRDMVGLLASAGGRP